jgi:hypothetical protein
MYDEFVEDYEPTKADSYRKKVVLDGEEVSYLYRSTNTGSNLPGLIFHLVFRIRICMDPQKITS